MHRDGISDREKRFWSASDLLNDGHVCPAGVHDIFPGAAKIDRLLDRTGQLVFALRYGLAWTIDRCPLGPDRYEDLLPIRDAAAVSNPTLQPLKCRTRRRLKWPRSVLSQPKYFTAGFQ